MALLRLSDECFAYRPICFGVKTDLNLPSLGGSSMLNVFLFCLRSMVLTLLSLSSVGGTSRSFYIFFIALGSCIAG